MTKTKNTCVRTTYGKTHNHTDMYPTFLEFSRKKTARTLGQADTRAAMLTQIDRFRHFHDFWRDT
jgi:hypothetical protein